ncbi:MAG: amino acid adenylation domain-containing protein [Chitinispirillales bacterium]|jgi:amino acid adenylation domain-containing protein|nr:amino acid adenylation domain-containing protein [Chitinispirillales bacterium]
MELLKKPQHGVIPKASVRKNLPLTFAERQMAAEQRMDPESRAYNINLALEIGGPLDISRLEKALAALVNRHTALRSYYPMENGEFVHRVLDELPVPLRVESCAPGDVEKLIQKNDTPYNIENAPLFRFTLYQTGESTAILNLAMHHIIMDGASAEVIIDELWQLYNGEKLPPLELDYTDYAAWQSENIDDGKGEEFFTQMFDGGVPETDMPTLPRRPDILPFADIDCVRIIDAGPIDEAARRLGVTTFRLLFAAAGLTLAKYCGSEDVALGTAMSGRPFEQTARTVGMFVNTLPIRVKTPGLTTASEYLKTVSESVKQVKSRQTCPFEKIVPILAPDRNASRSPIFDMVVNYLPEIKPPAVQGLSIRTLPVKRQALAIDLMLELLREGDKLRVVLSYSRELYQDEIISNMMELFITIVSRFVNDDGQTVLRDIAELPDAQRKQILEDFAGERCDENHGKTLVDLFNEQVKKTPANHAVVFGEKVLTYSEVNLATDRIAACLKARGVGKGDAVGILVHRGDMMPVGAMGVMKSGAAYMPLDPGYPAERLQFMIKDAGARIIIADEDLKDRVPTYSGEFLLTADIAKLPDGDIPAPPKPDDTMILLYTSGTTGNPKGVMLTHGNLTNFCTYYRNFHNITENDNVPAYASFGFDASMMDMYPTLISGACVHIIPEDMRLDLPGLRDYFDKNNISIAFITTQLGRQFAETMSCRGLRALSVGGETLVPIAPPKNYTLYNEYGPTECTVFITIFNVDKLYDRVPIGRALNNTALYVVDKNNRLAPVGAAGELCVAGRQVGKGYLNRPDITEEKFVKNPFNYNNDPDYAVMYRTGDVVRFLPDGNIDFVGRSDFQVKIRGFRVELTEIEERLRAFPSVNDAAVIATDAPGGGKCAVAYVVGESPIDVEALNQFIEEKLPSYMVPAATMQIDAIPLNPSGKVDRRKLPAPAFSAEKTENSARPLNDLEIKISQITAEILGHKDFGIGTNLLRAGLSSLSCIKLAAKIDEAFGVSVTVREIMKNPTLLGIENMVISLLLSRKTETTKPKELQADYPLSQSQTGVYLDCLKDPMSIRYNIPFLISLPADIDAQKLHDAVCRVIDAHPAVKIRIAAGKNGPVQIPDYTPAAIPLEQVSETELYELREKFVQPFDLAKGPLYRVRIIQTPDRAAMLADFHHAAFDGGSLDLFLREIGTVYGGGNPAVEKLTAFDAALEESEREGGSGWLADKAYFDGKLSGFESVSEIDPDINHDSTSGSLLEIVKKADRDAVLSFCKEEGVTPASLFFAATAYAVGRWTQKPDTYISGISSGRGDTRVLNTYGMFVRTLPLHIRREAGQSCLDFIREAQRTLADSVAHEGYPYTNIARDYGYSPSIMFACELGLGITSGYQVGGAEARFEILAANRPKFKLSVHIEERGGDMVFAVQYNDALYSKTLMEHFADTLSAALQNLIKNSSAPVSGVSLLSERQCALIESFNSQTAADMPEGVLHRMFEAAMEKTPGHTALIAAEGSYTYARLNAEANRVANALLSLGVQKEDRVAILLRRTGRTLIAMLGALKAGGAYIPLDPEYPKERIAHVLSDSGAKYMLTEKEFAAEFENTLDIDAVREGQSEDNPDIDVSPNDLAYIIYTSGSTGKPKGVMIEHRGIANYVDAHPKNIHVHALAADAACMMSITTVAFDMFLKESMTSLCNGVTLVFAGDDAARDPALLAKLFEETGADAFNTTPSVMMEYTEHPALLAAIRKCKVVMCGAEKYPETLLKRLHGGSGTRLFNTYGPTEISVSCNGKELTGASRVTIGKPLLNVREQVVDTDGNALPCGVIGELLIGGRGVARGYVNLPEMTAGRFVNYNGERMYRSGDFARWTADGEIELLGRSDNQVKLRGLRIELGEIENAVHAIDGIRACAVIIRKLQNADHLCAYYAAEREIAPEEVKEALKRTLTGYMIPTAYLQIPAMPKTPSGKTDLRALPAPALLRQSGYEAPQGEAEEKLCGLFAGITGAERVGALDNFFEIGGTSLAVTRVVIEAEAAGLCGVNGERISYTNVFAHPTPRELAKLLAAPDAETQQAPVREEKYDYSAIHALLAEGSLDAFRRGAARKTGDVLLTGATGFLGIHVLHGLLKSDAGGIYCLVRRSKGGSAETRLRNLLFYYFEDAAEDWKGRLKIVEGDMTDEACLAAIPRIDTVINCAANVTHFSKDSSAFDVNTGGVVNLIGFCRKHGSRLIHISTASIAGFSVGGSPSRDTVMDETMLFFGQNLENQYVHSKFMAERTVLEAALNGLDAKIMRVGNLMARNKDGEFQINARENSFLGRLRAYHTIGCFPYSAYNNLTELAPIDSTTAAVLLLAETSESCRVFHPYNNHKLFVGDIILTMKNLGMNIEMVEDDVFQSALSSTMKDPARIESLTSLIAYQNMARGKMTLPVAVNNDYTTQALLRMGWHWPETNREYLCKFLDGVKSLGMFGGDGDV